ncbi:MAG: hypothetical protein PUB22_05315 [Clostridiales bacterium]|nr:hypothetical protein [Clostridiales bacterium]
MRNKIKTAWFFLAAAAIIALGGAAVTGVSVDAKKDDVRVILQDVEGERGYLNGLTIQILSSIQRQDGKALQWKTDFVPDSNISETEFSFGIPDYRIESNHLEVYIGYDTGFSVYGSLLSDFEEEDMNSGFREAARGVAERTGKGRCRRETLHLKDYQDYYYPSVSIYQDDFYLTGFQNKVIQNYFRIPVREEDQLSVEVMRDNEGNVYSYSIELGNTKNIDIPLEEADESEAMMMDDLNRMDVQTASAATEDGVYILIWGKQAEEMVQEADQETNHMTEPGLWYLPISVLQETEEVTSNSPEAKEAAGQIQSAWKLITPADDNWESAEMEVSPDGNQLFLYIESNGDYRIQVFDAKTGEWKQDLTLEFPAKDSIPLNRYVMDDYQVLYYYCREEEAENEMDFSWGYDEESGEYYYTEPVESQEDMVVLEKGEDGSWELFHQTEVDRMVLLGERYMDWYNLEQGFHYDQGTLTVLGSVGQSALLLDIFRQDGSHYRGILMLEGGGSLQSYYCRMF